MTLPKLTRRRDNDPHREGWNVYYAGVRVGHIGRRAGVPVHADQWGWSCGFYPGCDPGEQTHGTGQDFEEARAGFEIAWNRLLPKKTAAHFELWRFQQDMESWKQRMWAEGRRLPTQTREGRAHCFCGTEITASSTPSHVQSAHRSSADLQPD